MEKKSIIKQSTKIREALKKRFSELGLSYTQVANEASRFNVKVKIETLSRYFNGQHRSSLTEEGIIFLCYRYGIPITLNVGYPIVANSKLTTEIPKYDEKRCLATTRKLWKENMANKPSVQDNTRASGQKGDNDSNNKRRKEAI